MPTLPSLFDRDKDKLLLKAVEDGNIDKVQKLLDGGANIEAADNDRGWTPLHVACYNGRIEVAKMLLARDANVEATDKDGYTPLYHACIYGKVEVTEMLLARGANYSQKPQRPNDDDGNNFSKGSSEAEYSDISDESSQFSLNRARHRKGSDSAVDVVEDSSHGYLKKGEPLNSAQDGVIGVQLSNGVTAIQTAENFGGLASLHHDSADRKVDPVHDTQTTDPTDNNNEVVTAAESYCQTAAFHHSKVIQSTISTISQDSSSVHSSSETYQSSYDYESDSSDDFDASNFLFKHSLYNQEPITCPICTEQIEEGLAIILPSCHHSFCTACFLKYLNARVGEGDADVIGCPYILEEGKSPKQCKALVGEEVLEEIMDASSYQKFMDQKNSAFVRKNVDYHNCPTPDCANIVLCKSVEMLNIPRVCDCFMCGRQTCLSCGASPFHKNRTCEEYREELRRREEGQRFDHGRARRICLRGELGLYRHTTEAEAQYEFQPKPSSANNSEEESRLNNIKRCRRCGNGIERHGGCLHMRCLCGYVFCYRCGSENAQCECWDDSDDSDDWETGWGTLRG